MPRGQSNANKTNENKDPKNPNVVVNGNTPSVENNGNPLDGTNTSGENNGAPPADNADEIAVLKKEIEELKKAPNNDEVAALNKRIAELEKSLKDTPKGGDVVVKRAEDIMITVYFMGQNGEGLSDKVIYGNGKSKTFRNFRDKATMSLTEFEQEFAQAPLAINFFQRGLLVLGADTPQSVIESFEVEIETPKHLSKRQYKELLSRGVNELVETYESVCASQKELILETVVTAIEVGNDFLTRDMVERLNNATKVDGLGEGKLKNHLIRFDEKAAETY